MSDVSVNATKREMQSEPTRLSGSRTSHEYQCCLKNKHDANVRIYFLQWDWIEAVHWMNPAESRRVYLKKGQTILVAFDVEHREFLACKVLKMDGPQTIPIP